MKLGSRGHVRSWELGVGRVGEQTQWSESVGRGEPDWSGCWKEVRLLEEWEVGLRRAGQAKWWSVLLSSPSKESGQRKMRQFWRCWCQKQRHETLGTGEYKVEGVLNCWDLSYPLSRRWLFQPAKPHEEGTGGKHSFKLLLAFILLIFHWPLVAL